MTRTRGAGHEPGDDRLGGRQGGAEDRAAARPGASASQARSGRRCRPAASRCSGQTASRPLGHRPERATTGPLAGNRSRYRFTRVRRARARATTASSCSPRDGGAHVPGTSRVSTSSGAETTLSCRRRRPRGRRPVSPGDTPFRPPPPPPPPTPPPPLPLGRAAEAISLKSRCRRAAYPRPSTPPNPPIDPPPSAPPSRPLSRPPPLLAPLPPRSTPRPSRSSLRPLAPPPLPTPRLPASPLRPPPLPVQRAPLLPDPCSSPITPPPPPPLPRPDVVFTRRARARSRPAAAG